jgi:hypothetical protein
MAAVDDREPPIRLRGLTGYRYLFAVLVLVALATVPMVLAVVAGQAILDRSPTPAVEPFLSPDSPGDSVDRVDPADPEHFADHELTAMSDGNRSTGDTGWLPPGGSRMLW